MTPDIKRMVADISKRFSESLKYLAQADRNPEGHDPAEGHGAKHESPVVADDAPKRNRRDNNGLG